MSRNSELEHAMRSSSCRRLRGLQSLESSKAYGDAMRALQGKLSFVESENLGLRDRMISTESRLAGERESFYGESPNSQEEQESRRFLGELQKLREQLYIKDSQIEYLEQSLVRAEQNFLFERESSQLESFEKNRFDNAKQRTENEDLRRETAQERKRRENCQNELDCVKQAAESRNLRFQESYSQLESEFHKKNTVLTQKLRNLQQKIGTLQETNRRQATEIEFLKEEVRGKPTVFSKRHNSRPDLHSAIRNKSAKSRPTNTREIESLEHEISMLNREYRVLIDKSKTEVYGLPEIRQDLDTLLNSIERKSQWLLDLKKLQQESLKRQLGK